jgi:uncharacterized protein YjlB
MPVYRPADRDDGQNIIPSGFRFNSAGVFLVRFDGGQYEAHYHNTDELWYVLSGKAKVRVGEHEYYVQAGDIVHTPAGEDHDVLEVYADFRAFWVEGAPAGDAAGGNQYRDAAGAEGHPVPGRPLPTDFPRF